MENHLKKQTKKPRKKVAEPEMLRAEEKHLLDLLGGIISQSVINEVKL